MKKTTMFCKKKYKNEIYEIRKIEGIFINTWKKHKNGGIIQFH